jgi:hypothetical protein
MNWQDMDTQMSEFSARLINDAKLTPKMTEKLATSIAADVRFLSAERKLEIRLASPVPLQNRLDELSAFQDWMDYAKTISLKPFLTRAQVITQNYICFVYLPEACFRVLAKACPSDSAAKKCAEFLNNNRVRSFRNAVAHSNWTYRSDFQAIIFWARKGDGKNEPLHQFEVEKDELRFWQALSRCVAYAAYSNL